MNTANKKIILVEDDKILSTVMYDKLQTAGFEVERAFDGEKGLALITARKPDLVLLDIVMPKKTGLEVLTALKALPETKAIPVIILTVLGSDDQIKKGLALGANDYIVKTEHAIGEVVEKVQSFLAQTKQ